MRIFCGDRKRKLKIKKKKPGGEPPKAERIENRGSKLEKSWEGLRLPDFSGFGNNKKFTNADKEEVWVLRFL